MWQTTEVSLSYQKPSFASQIKAENTKTDESGYGGDSALKKVFSIIVHFSKGKMDNVQF